MSNVGDKVDSGNTFTNEKTQFYRLGRSQDAVSENKSGDDQQQEGEDVDAVVAQHVHLEEERKTNEAAIWNKDVLMSRLYESVAGERLAMVCQDAVSETVL